MTNKLFEINNIVVFIPIISFLGTFFTHVYYLGYSYYFSIEFYYINVNIAYMLSNVAILILLAITTEFFTLKIVKKFFDKYKIITYKVLLKFTLLKVMLPLLTSILLYRSVDIANYFGFKFPNFPLIFRWIFLILLIVIIILSFCYSLFQIFGSIAYFTFYDKKHTEDNKSINKDNKNFSLILVLCLILLVFTLTALGLSYFNAKMKNTFDIVENYAVNENNSKSDYAVLSRKNGYLYLVRCKITENENLDKLDLDVWTHIFIRDENIISHLKSFNKVEKKRIN